MAEPVSALLAAAAQAEGSGDGVSVFPALLILVVGFALGAYGHAARARWLVALGILIVIAAIVLFQAEVRTDAPERLPPGV
jgi:hypothetical protein